MFVNNNTGYVGIGTTSPGQKLHVVGDILLSGDLRDGNNNIFIHPENRANAVNYFQIRSSEAGTPIGIHALGSDTNIDLELRPKGTGKVTIDGAKNAALYLYGNSVVGDGARIETSSASADRKSVV